MQQTNGATLQQIVVFTLDEPCYALPLDVVRRVVRMVDIMPLPKAPDIVCGAINMQGEIIAVVDVRKRFRLPKRPLDPNDRLIIAQTPQRCVALQVDTVSGVRTFSEREMIGVEQALPFAEYLQGVVKTEEGMILISDLETFLSLDEARMLNSALSEGVK